MHDPLTRILTALELLQACDRVTGTELAARLEVDLRTVQRYIARLRNLNIPVEASPGVGGSYRLRPGFRLPPLLLTNEEAFAVSLGLRALRQVGLEAFAPATQGALSKLSRVLPFALRDGLQALDGVITFEPNSWMVSADTELLMKIASAIRTGEQICFLYRSHRQQLSERVVEPYAILHTDERWYLLGHCLDRQKLRTFRLDRVTRLQVSSIRFTRPENFDPRRYLEENLPFVQSGYDIDLWIDLPLEEARRSFALWRVVLEGEGAGSRLRCSRDNLDFFAAMLLSTRRRIVVHRPAALREVFHALAAEAARAASALPDGRNGGSGDS